DQRVPAKVAWVLAREVEALVARPQFVVRELEPLDERDVRLGACRRPLAGPSLLDAAVPRADVLADVAAVDLRSELGAVLLGDGAGRRAPGGGAAGRVERAGIVERARGTGLEAGRARAAVEGQPRGRLELGLGDERPQHDPRAVLARDQHRVLA